MKCIFLFSSLLAMVSVSGAAAAANVESVKGLLLSGELSAYGGWASVSDPDDELDDDSYFVYGGSGVLSVPLGDMFSIQGDILGERNDSDRDDEGAVEAFGYGAHLSLRDPNLGLLGVFGGQGESNHPGDSDDQDVQWIGAEGQYYLDALTLYGQVGWTETDSTHDPLDSTSVFARGAVRYFFHENFMLQGDLQYTTGQIHSDDLDAFGWGLKAKYGFDELPIYLTAEYRGTNYDGHGEGAATEHVGLVGLSIALGASSLQEQDRYGATLETPSLVLRAPSWASVLD